MVWRVMANGIGADGQLDYRAWVYLSTPPPDNWRDLIVESYYEIYPDDERVATPIPDRFEVEEIDEDELPPGWVDTWEGIPQAYLIHRTIRGGYSYAYNLETQEWKLLEFDESLKLEYQ